MTVSDLATCCIVGGHRPPLLRGRLKSTSILDGCSNFLVVRLLAASRIPHSATDPRPIVSPSPRYRFAAFALRLIQTAPGTIGSAGFSADTAVRTGQSRWPSRVLSDCPRG